MGLADFWRKLGQDEDEVDGIRARLRGGFDFLQCGVLSKVPQAAIPSNRIKAVALGATEV